MATFLLAGCMDFLDGLSDDGTVTPRGPNMVIGAPQLWGGTFNSEFEVGNDYGVVHGGRASAFVRMLQPRLLNETQFGVLVQNIRADAYLGSRIKVSAWLRTTGLTGNHGAGLWLRVDGQSFNVFDDTGDRRISTASEWQQVSMVADVPDDAIGLTYGVILASTGIVWADDFRIEVVDETVPVTAVHTPVTTDPESLMRIFEVLPMAPRNLDFEGDVTPASRPDTRDWVLSNSFAFSSDDPSASLTEMEPLRAKVGNATIVGLGEATHGTREFQRMKHRLVQFLVSEMGFSHFGMEAPLSSAMMFDHYLQTGEGDPAQLLEAWYM